MATLTPIKLSASIRSDSPDDLSAEQREHMERFVSRADHRARWLAECAGAGYNADALDDDDFAPHAIVAVTIKAREVGHHNPNEGVSIRLPAARRSPASSHRRWCSRPR